MLNGVATRRFPDGDPEGRIDALIVLVGTATMLIVTVSLHATGGPLLRNVAIIAMPLTMAPILAACIRLLITGAHRLPAAWGMTRAAAINLAACPTGPACPPRSPMTSPAPRVTMPR